MSAFINTKDGNCYFRTKLFRSEARAEAFCKCLSANRRFQNASVIESHRTDNGWFVQYQPSNPARYADLYYAQYHQRELKGKGEGRCYEWNLHSDTGNRAVFYLCKSTSGEVYEVTECSCTCPDWTYRGKKSGLPCKHQHAYAVAVATGEIKAIAEVKLRAARVTTVNVTPTMTREDKTAALQYRSRLIRLARRAYLKWGQACEQYNEILSVYGPYGDCPDLADRRAKHLGRRYNKLETAIADATGLSKFSILNQISKSWPTVPALLVNL